MDATMGTTVVTETVEGDQRASMVVIERCARLEGVDPLDLDPLYDAIDPDVLDSVCAAPGFSSLEFTYCDRTVTLRAVGDDLRVTIDDATSATSSGSATDGEPSI